MFAANFKQIKTSNWHSKLHIGVQNFKLAFKTSNWRSKLQISVQDFKLAFKTSKWRFKLYAVE